MACQKEDDYLQAQYTPKFGKNIEENIDVRFTKAMIAAKEQSKLQTKQGYVLIKNQDELYNFFKSLCDFFFCHIWLKDIVPKGKQMDIYPQACSPVVKISLSLSSLNVEEEKVFSKVVGWDFDYEGFTEDALQIHELLKDIDWTNYQQNDEEVNGWINTLEDVLQQESSPPSTTQAIPESCNTLSTPMSSNNAPSPTHTPNAFTTNATQLSTRVQPNNHLATPPSACDIDNNPASTSAATTIDVAPTSSGYIAASPSAEQIRPQIDFNSGVEGVTTLLNQLLELADPSTNRSGNPTPTKISSLLRNAAAKKCTSRPLSPSTATAKKSPLHALEEMCTSPGKAAKKRSASETSSSDSEEQKRQKIDSPCSSTDCTSNDDEDEADKSQELKNTGFNIEGGAAKSFRNFLDRKERKLYDDTRQIFTQNVKNIHDTFAVIVNWINTLDLMLNQIPFEMDETTGRPIIQCVGCMMHCPAKIKMKPRKGRPKKANVSKYDKQKSKKKNYTPHIKTAVKPVKLE